jgi:hypothetical protein
MHLGHLRVYRPPRYFQEPNSSTTIVSTINKTFQRLEIHCNVKRVDHNDVAAEWLREIILKIR